MALPPEPGRFRHVGRIVDPGVREDGDPEPELTLEGPAQETAPDGRSGAPDAPPPEAGSAEPIERGSQMRARLLERARLLGEHQAETEQPSFGDLDEIGQNRPATVEAETETPSLRAPGAPRPARKASQLSPSLIAIFGTLMGVAIVAALSAMIGHLAPRRDMPKTESVPVPTARTPRAPQPMLVKKPPRQKQPGPWRIGDAANDPSTRVGDGKVGSDAFLTAVQKIGVSQHDAFRLVAAFKSIRSFDKCAKQDRLSALLDRATSRLKAFEYVVSPEEVYQAREGSDGLLKAARLDLKIEHGPVQGSLVYDGSSFDASAERAGFDPGLGRVLSKALDGHLSLDELERGDVVRVLAQEVTVLGEFARYSGVEAVELRRVGKDQPLRIYFFDAAGERGYYDAQGRAPFEGGWRKPIPTAAITSPFNLKRFHPILKKIMPHLGIDFGATMGTPVGASSFGTVSFMAYAGATGNLVKIEHAGGVETGYAHLSRFADGLKVGDKVH
ncbi:MAG TPA: M23 family metallopeptidase, partial [Polyangiaceae bacterium]|nr:M23 family metallopeptidase [Polyangiaceae bacterium]